MNPINSIINHSQRNTSLNCFLHQPVITLTVQISSLKGADTPNPPASVNTLAASLYSQFHLSGVLRLRAGCSVCSSFLSLSCFDRRVSSLRHQRSHTSSDCGDYQHFTVFSVSNENVITGSLHLRPSKTLHFLTTGLSVQCSLCAFTFLTSSSCLIIIPLYFRHFFLLLSRYFIKNSRVILDH